MTIVTKPFQYGTLGELRQEFAVAPTTPRGITTNVSGSNVWVADYSGRIYNYTSSGAHVANWSSKITGLQGLTTDGTNIWTVSESTDMVYYYQGGTTYANGSYGCAKVLVLFELLQQQLNGNYE